MRRPSRTGKALVALALTASLVTGQATSPAPAQAQQFPIFQMPALPQFNEEQVQQAVAALVALAASVGGLALIAGILPGVGSSNGSSSAPAPSTTPATTPGTPTSMPESTQPSTSPAPTEEPSSSPEPTTSTAPAPVTSVEPSLGFAQHVAGIKDRLATSEEKNPLWAWTAPRGPQLTLPTHEGSGQATHPSVLFFENGWNGWKYWMAMTPYPASDEGAEDPNVVVSNDGWNWQVPDGLTNPIDDQLGKPNPHNSDTQLVMAPSGEMYLTWRTVDRPNGKTNRIYLVKSTDGVNWSEKEEIWTGEPQFMSQALIWTGENWRLYGIANHPGVPNRIIFYESVDLKTWSAPRYPSVDPYLQSNERWWHIDVQRHNGEYLGIVHIVPSDTVQNGNLYLMRSKDGINWKRSDTPIISHKESGYHNLYKSTLVPHGSGESLTFELYYSGFSEGRADWRINRTLAERVSAE
ncbi:hypothetical protein [Corynebacterium singulare]|uniref:Uncharacterized protein n=1 Tax=Corynebacterium singulare TaxID=161899 RepID=A0A0B6F4V9_9CORY|nr:hypothetical protein [Corynebacterium singulare]AJI79475.1 hypothetical protein CSING_09810 [Corynebacterium singulare]